jgi:hypothetical protein
MPIIKTKDLTGAALDWAVAKAEGINFAENGWKPINVFLGARVGGHHRYSTDWAQGGLLIDKYGVEFIALRQREQDGRITVSYRATAPKWFQFQNFRSFSLVTHDGPDHLTAAMRVVVTMELGDEVDVPDELVAS